MKSLTVVLLLLLAIVHKGYAQNEEYDDEHGYKLTFKSNDKSFPLQEQELLVKTFFRVYPILAGAFNPNTLKDVHILIDTAYKGVAATGDGHVVISAAYIKKHPNDIDVITHEVMHIVQDYKDESGPAWLTEGIADFARYKFGIANETSGWKLPAYAASANYTDSYRITARFLVWLDEKVKPGVVKDLDSQLRQNTYSVTSWEKLTGKSLDELWSQYSLNPVI
jgi:hypothetical protein